VADWKFELWITQAATTDYKRIQDIAEAAVSGFDGPLPISSDPRLSARLAAVNHYERTRTLLRSIRNPEDAGLDRGLIGPAHFVKYRNHLGTCVYYTRIVTTPPAVLIYGFSDAPLDPHGLRKIVLSGNIGLLEKYGLPTLEMGITNGLIH
jgi:hypothetical protein